MFLDLDKVIGKVDPRPEFTSRQAEQSELAGAQVAKSGEGGSKI